MTTATTFDFDAALHEAQQKFDRKAAALSAQDEVVQRLEIELAQAQRAHAEVQWEYDQAAQEEEALMTYLGKTYEVHASETRYWEPETDWGW